MTKDEASIMMEKIKQEVEFNNQFVLNHNEKWNFKELILVDAYTESEVLKQSVAGLKIKLTTIIESNEKMFAEFYIEFDFVSDIMKLLHIYGKNKVKWSYENSRIIKGS